VSPYTLVVTGTPDCWRFPEPVSLATAELTTEGPEPTAEDAEPTLADAADASGITVDFVVAVVVLGLVVVFLLVVVLGFFVVVVVAAIWCQKCNVSWGSYIEPSFV
jgi:hypothetical protein